MLIPAVQKSDSVIHIYILFSKLFIHFCIFGSASSPLLHADFLQLWRASFLLQRLLLLQSRGSVAVVHGLAAAWHVASSQTRDRTRVPCAGRQIPIHCTTREVPCSSVIGGAVNFLNIHRTLSQPFSPSWGLLVLTCAGLILLLWISSVFSGRVFPLYPSFPKLT